MRSRLALIWLAIIAGYILAVVLMAGAVSLSNNTPLRESLGTAAFWAPIGIILFHSLWNTSRWLEGRFTGGQVLLDFSLEPIKEIGCVFFLAVMVFVPCLVVFTAMGIFLLFKGEVLWYALCSPLVLLSFLSAIYMHKKARSQIMEGGISVPFGWLPWRKIDSYSWTSDSTLLLTTKSSVPYLGQGKVGLIIPSEHKSQFEELMIRFCHANARR
jgi:hypothetical protein